MSDADDAVEFRELQARAYGRGGGLGPAEAARLAHLEDARRRAAGDGRGHASRDAADVTPDAAPSADDADHPRDAPQETRQDAGVDPAGDEDDAGETAVAPPGAGGEDAGARPSLRSTLRSHGRALGAVAAAALVVGITAGWILFAPPSDDIPLTAAQQERRQELVDEGDYDPGSVSAVGAKDDALVWYGTKDDGALTCLTLDVGKLTDTQCQPYDDSDGLTLQAFVWSPPDENGEMQESVVASMRLSTRGEPMVAVERWNQNGAFLDQFAGDERDRAQELVDEGYDTGFSVVGYFRDEPVWMAQSYTDDVEPQTCLIVDGADRQDACGPMSAVAARGISVVAADPGATRGDVLTLAFTPGQTPYLTIAADVEVVTATVVEGTRAEVGGERGDPIEIGISSDDADD